jgi:hypothetical protein
MQRRDLLKFGLGAGVAMAAAPITSRSWAQSNVAALPFNETDFAELTTTVTVDGAEKAVVYRFYKAIPYVANPVDAVYQSLNISVPVSIDGVSVDASGAPILFANKIGGYMPSSVVEATGIDASPVTGLAAPDGAAAGGGLAVGGPDGAAVESGGNAMVNRGEQVSNPKLALAAGYVVVEPGARGRSLTDASGTYYGVAPAAIVDLKAAVRFIRANSGVIPGNTDWIVSSGTSAGGALSALLGASGDSDLYTDALAELGAADASDAIFATGAWCPITDLEHADMAYEWNWGDNPLQSGALVDQAVSAELEAGFSAYQKSLGLEGEGDFGALTAERYGDYMVQAYLAPAATAYLAALSETDRAAYLAENPEISWQDGQASFTWSDFQSHVGQRKKNVPAFDAFDLSAGENNLFGANRTAARHFTEFSLRHTSGDTDARIDADLPGRLEQMNPMPFLLSGHQRRSQHWWLRVGTSDTDTSLTVVGNLAAAAENLGDEVSAAMYWDAGHGANEDASAFIRWIKDITGYNASA